MISVYVSELAIYPVKSLAQISLKESRVDDFGLENDRRWMVVDEKGHFITQRQQSRMCLIQVKLIYVKSRLNAVQLSAIEMPSITVELPSTKKSVLVTVWHDQCNAIDCGDAVADWLSEFLSVKCRLVYFTQDEIRQVDQTFAKPKDKTAFSDGFPFLLISQASLDNLNNKLDVALPMKRFRPNIVVTGCDAFAEDNWKKIRIGDLVLRVVKPCSRCVIPNINTET
ncbi:MAG: MOSC domain-containing protein, partial [Thiohalomonadales bacterium]